MNDKVKIAEAINQAIQGLEAIHKLKGVIESLYKKEETNYEVRYWNIRADLHFLNKFRPSVPDCTLDEYTLEEIREEVLDYAKRWKNVEVIDKKTGKVIISYNEAS